MNSFKRNLIIGYSCSLILLILSSAASYISIRNLLDSQKLVEHNTEVLTKLEQVLSVLKDAETGQRGYLITGNQEFLEPYNGAHEKILTTLGNTRRLLGDDQQQQASLNSLSEIILKRLNYLGFLINKKNKGETVTDSLMVSGKELMDNARNLVTSMQQREQLLLDKRTVTMNQFAAATPILIIGASLLGIIITLVSLFKVNADFDKKAKMQQELLEKDEEITKRIISIEHIAGKISEGDYTVRALDEDKDSLGSLAVSLNKMASSLDSSFDALKQKEWMQTGIAELSEIMIGEKNLQVLSQSVIEFMTKYTESQVGAFYLAKNENTLGLTASIALNKSSLNPEVTIGEGVVGRSAASGKEVYITDIDETDMLLDCTVGTLKPKAIIAIPIYHERKLKGVLQLAAGKRYPNIIHDFLKDATFNIGTAIHSARDHQRLQDLLAETQAQSEELQSQHSELENINAELEAQAEKLQASDEELRVQQEELQQANQELEERSSLLEEKNELILERNLDIQAKSEALELSTRYKSEFLANMSHELRTPLNSILLLSRLLSENPVGNLSTDQIEYADVIQSSGKGLLTLIDEILDLSKIESGKMELEYSSVNLKTFSKEINGLFMPIAKDKGLAFSVQLEEGTPAEIETDSMRLDQIIRNLVSNALKFTKQGEVSLVISKSNGDVSFAVKDSGIGIPAEKHQTIFEAFQQADGSTRRQYGGTGLGLSISRELAKLLGGEIRLQSKEGAGSVFTLIIPRDKSSVVAKKITTPATEIPSMDATETAPKKVQDTEYLSDRIPEPVPDDRDLVVAGDKVILIIEDDTAFAKSLLDYTRQQNYKGIVAVRGDEGIELAKKFLPLGILLDVQLPVKSGWEVMEALKTDKRTRPIPVHMMSSHQVKNKSLTRGAVDFINKPVAYEKLGDVFKKIEDALSRHPKKVLIVEENPKHAQALAYFLEGFTIHSEIKNSVGDGIKALNQANVDCVILDMGMPTQNSYDTLEQVKKTPGLENLPIIIFTGKNVSHVEEVKIKQYADSIVVKTAHSYQRILDEVSLFLHLVDEGKNAGSRYRKLGELSEVLKGKTVLVADDDVRNIFSLTKSLEVYGMNVLSAMDGKEALQKLKENKNVDLVLMDMMMPEMDGYESTKRIREIPAFKKLPVIAVTAKAMTGDREKCISAGASDYITKPVDVDQLISLLRVWLYN